MIKEDERPYRFSGICRSRLHPWGGHDVQPRRIARWVAWQRRAETAHPTSLPWQSGTRPHLASPATAYDNTTFPRSQHAEQQTTSRL